MASYQGVKAALSALEAFFTRRLPAELSGEPVNARVSLLGSADIANSLSGNLLGIYLHRLTIDPHGRSRSFAPTGSQWQRGAPELPVNMHFLLIANATAADYEADLITWAMVELANHSQLDFGAVSTVDGEWGEQEVLTITPEEMSTEDLMRVWDVFERPYTSTVPYMARTVRLRLNDLVSDNGPVATRVFPAGVAP